jgi:ribose transport system permease protein
VISESTNPETPAVQAQEPVVPPRRSLVLGRWAERLALPVLLGAIVVFFSFWSKTGNTFDTHANLESLALTQCVVAVAALAATVPLVAGQFDVSIGPILGLSSVLAGVITVQHGLPVWIAVIAGPILGIVSGTASGYVVAYLNTNSFIITLGTGTLLGGIASVITHDQIITGAPQSLVDVGTRSWAGIPILAWILIAVASVLAFLLRNTLYGRHLTQIGSNSKAARTVGVHVNRVVLLSFVVSGAFAGLAGVLLFAQTGAANPAIGPGYTLPALAAAFLGATTIRPGHFNVLGTLVGVFFVGVAVNGLTLAGAADWVQPAFNGGALVVAVAMSSLLSRQASKAR